jgi:hypothetical protein
MSICCGLRFWIFIEGNKGYSFQKKRPCYSLLVTKAQTLKILRDPLSIFSVLNLYFHKLHAFYRLVFSETNDI